MVRRLRLPGARGGQPAPRRRGAEPAGGETLPRAASPRRAPKRPAAPSTRRPPQLGRATGTGLGKRQVEGLTVRAAADFTAFYAIASPAGTRSTTKCCWCCRSTAKASSCARTRCAPATAKAAEAASPKLDEPAVQRGEALPQTHRGGRRGGRCDPRGAHRRGHPARHRRRTRERPTDGPTATGKWLTASVVDDAATVVAAVFDEATRRDPDPHPPLGRARRRGEPPDRPDHTPKQPPAG